MQRDLGAFLLDIETAGQRIVAFTSHKELEDYLADDLLRSGVERQFLIIGEAIARARQTSPEIMLGITSASAIVGFRNRLVHAYETLRDETVWDAVQKSLPVLLSEVTQMLKTLESTPNS